MNPINFEWLAVSMAITWLLLWLEHWFRYPFKRHVIFNYSAGVSAILIGITVYCVHERMVVSVLIVWAFSLIAGAAVGTAYLIDWASNSILRLQDEQPKNDD